jgi:DUF1009 family protein
MGLFEEEFNQQIGESRFEKLNLEELFPTAEDKQNLQNVIAALQKTTDDNLVKLRMQELGEQGLEILIKVAKKVLL